MSRANDRALSPPIAAARSSTRQPYTSRIPMAKERQQRLPRCPRQPAMRPELRVRARLDDATLQS